MTQGAFNKTTAMLSNHNTHIPTDLQHNNTIKQGEFNKLSVLFSCDNRLVIPDLQRDYCWGNTYIGDKKNSLAFNFTVELITESHKADSSTENSYGIVYAYEYPQSFLHLCDGQQRLTTLYLIIGVLNHYLKNQQLESLLILHDGQPRLKYEVRHTTDYFINEFIKEIKSDKKTDLSDLSNANWFREEYNDDPSIKSMVEAITDINTLLENADKNAVADFIAEKLGFVYIKLEAHDSHTDTTNFKIREYGEKMYEIVNTTGNPMEYNEHQKSLLLSRVHESQREEMTEKWEVWQDFFWQIKREKDESADDGFNKFLEWIEDIEGDNSFGIDVVESYFKAFYLLIQIQEELVSFRKFKILDIRAKYQETLQPNPLVLYPCLVYLRETLSVNYTNKQYRIDNNSINFDSLFRFVRFFSNWSLRINDNKVNRTRMVSLAYTFSKGIENTPVANVVHNHLINSTEEAFKLRIFENQLDLTARIQAEDILWEAEDHAYLNGKIESLILWSGSNLQANTIDFSSFTRVYQHLYNLFTNDATIEKVRVALLANCDNLWEFREGWSWGKERYFLGTSKENWWWRKTLKSNTFDRIFRQIIQDETIDNIIQKTIDETNDQLRKSICLIIKDQASTHSQWCNHKRFFIYDNAVWLPNGMQAKSNVVQIPLPNDLIVENEQSMVEQEA